MENPLVSICCSTYNHVNYLQDALDGFIMQRTNFDFEILIHDDASTDGTTDIVRRFEKQYPKLVKPIYQTENQYSKGVSPGRINRDRAQGKYIALCEGDDYWTDPLKLQKQVDFLECNPEYSLCCHGFNVVDYDGMLIKTQVILKNDFDFSYEDNLNRWLTKTLTVVFVRDCIDFNVLKQYRYARDVQMYYHILKNGKGRYLAQNYANYRQHDGGVHSSIPYMKRIRTSYFIYSELIAFNKKDLFLKRVFDKVALQYKAVEVADDLDSNKSILSFSKALSSGLSLKQVIVLSLLLLVFKLRK